ncbi:CNP1-like family protein [Sedimenticola thiotaurini]|uniref:CNP1-like family protein n=1 Tax=Sedimenticola thiotaurini TaxID=1543721 RepID=UPI0006998520|nr:CNP1-like family protein [Sedimenticola thiotaurini]
MKKFALLLVMPLTLLVGSYSVQATDTFKARKGEQGFYGPHETYNPNVEEYTWVEKNAKLPPFPEDDNLIEFEVNSANPRFRYFIDAKSVSYTKEDGVVRYTVVVRSRSGANNVAFEGMRCSTKEYKTYAFGNGKGEFVQPRRSEWRPIIKNVNTLYRDNLADFYFCNPNIVNVTAERIVRELKYPTTEARELGLH